MIHKALLGNELFGTPCLLNCHSLPWSVVDGRKEGFHGMRVVL